MPVLSNTNPSNWDSIPPLDEIVRELPPEGNLNAVIADVVYGGRQPSKFQENGTPTLFVGFGIDSVIKSGKFAGKRHRIWRRVSYLLAPKGVLYSIVVAAFGKAYPRDPNGQFRPTTLIGRPIMAEIVHSKRNGTIYADISTFGRHVNGLPVLTPETDVPVPQWIQDCVSSRLDKPGN